MEKKSLDSLTISTPINSELTCVVKEEFILDHINARIKREIVYSNKSSAEIPINIRSWSFNFPFQCNNFKCFINNVEAKHKIEKGNYLKILKNIKTEDVLLKPNDSIKIIIYYVWKNFISFINNIYLEFSFIDEANYQLSISNFPLKDKPYKLIINNKEAKLNEDYFINENSLIINKQLVSPNNLVDINILTVQTPSELSLLSYYTPSGDKFSDCIIVLIQHLLSDFVHLVKAFNECGAEKDDIFIIGIPYSTKEHTKEYLGLENYKNIKVPIEYPFDDLVRTTLLETINLSESKSKKILIVEDGGYAVPILHNELLDKKDFFLGAVEQTANGIWRDREIKSNSKIDFCIPVINVAESEIKKRLESPLIASAVRRNIELLIGREYFEVKNKCVSIMGYGNTGSMIAESLKSIGAKLKVYDKDIDKRKQAISNKYIVAKSPLDLIKDSDIIVEATGNPDPWCKEEELLELKHGCYFLSASSKRMGIDYNKLNRLTKRDSQIYLPGIGIRYTLHNDNTVTLLANGFPINFFIGESVPDKSIAFILTLLFKSAEFVKDNVKRIPKEIIDMNNNTFGLRELQEDIEKMHNKLS